MDWFSTRKFCKHKHGAIFRDCFWRVNFEHFTHPASRKYPQHTTQTSGLSHRTTTAQISWACNEVPEELIAFSNRDHPMELVGGGLKIPGTIYLQNMLSNREAPCLRASSMLEVCMASKSTQADLGKRNPPQALSTVAAYKPSQPLLVNASSPLASSVPRASMHLHFSFCSL